MYNFQQAYITFTIQIIIKVTNITLIYANEKVCAYLTYHICVIHVCTISLIYPSTLTLYVYYTKKQNVTF